MATRAALVIRPIEPTSLLAEVAGPGRGATSMFVGTVRDSHGGRIVDALEYAAYEAMATRELEKILAEAAARFDAPAIAAEHRLGTLQVGEICVAIAAAHARRASAMAATQYVVEELKRRLPIWKLEHYSDGTREWVDAASPGAASGDAVPSEATPPHTATEFASAATIAEIP